MGATLIAITTDGVGDGIVAAGAQCDEIMERRLVGDFGVAGWSVMHFKSPKRPVVVTETATIIVQDHALPSFVSPRF